MNEELDSVVLEVVFRCELAGIRHQMLPVFEFQALLLKPAFQLVRPGEDADA